MGVMSPIRSQPPGNAGLFSETTVNRSQRKGELLYKEGVTGMWQRSFVRAPATHRIERTTRPEKTGEDMVRMKALKLAVLATFAATSIGCGTIEMPMALALSGDDNFISFQAGDSAAEEMQLEGGVATTMALELDLFDLILQQAVFGSITIDDLLFGGTELNILGVLPSEEVCVIQDPDAPGSGLTTVNIFEGLIQFQMNLVTNVVFGNPALMNILGPKGFPFDLSVEDEAQLGLIEMLSLAFGNSDGAFEITQTIDNLMFDFTLGPLTVPVVVNAQLTLATASEIPVGPLVQQCIDLGF